MGYKIAVLMSTYAHRGFVEKKINEIQRQTLFDQTEFIFIETASPEKEREVLKPFCDAHANCKLIALAERKTLYEAWNLGWAATQAPFVCYSNMDDAMHPCLLEQVVATLRQTQWGACSVLIAKQMADDKRLNDWSVEHLKRLPLSLRPGPFTAWRNDLKDSIGTFDGQFFVAGDKDFWSRLIANKVRFGLVKKVLYLYTKDREHQLSKSKSGKRRLQEDEKRFAQRPYPIQWSYKMRWQIFFLRYFLKIFPRSLTLAP